MIIINYQLNCKYNIRIVVFLKMKVVFTPSQNDHPCSIWVVVGFEFIRVITNFKKISYKTPDHYTPITTLFIGNIMGRRRMKKTRGMGWCYLYTRWPPLPFGCRLCCETKTWSCVCYTCKQLACCTTCFNRLQDTKCPLCRSATHNGKSLWIIYWCTMPWINKKKTKQNLNRYFLLDAASSSS